MAAIGPAAVIQPVPDEYADRVREHFEQFLEDFSSEAHLEDELTRAPVRDYLAQINMMRQNDRTTLYVSWRHVVEHEEDLAEAIMAEYYRCEPALRKGVQNFVRRHHEDYVKDQENEDKEFWISFYDVPAVMKLRDLNTEKIGKLLCVGGTVTRTSEVRPELLFGTFKCLECSHVVHSIEQQFKFTEPVVCPAQNCDNKTKWELMTEESVFVDFQKIRVQENTNEIPSGSMPRSMDIVLRHEAVEKAKAGDKCVFTGTLIVIPDVGKISRTGGKSMMRSANSRIPGDMAQEGVTGLKILGVRDLTYRLAFYACSVQPAEARFGTVNIRDESGDAASSFTDQELEEIRRMKQQPDLYNVMARSVAPNIFGHDEIKRGVLLMLFGGVHKNTRDGTKLRGDMNVCIVGDPSTAKSQFLKYVVSFLPRAVYTSGKASSAAGLTATVAKDPETGEFCIEAGALMLADNGICCIDEFDKMELKDQVAIHEAMEQQTISIAKAGIQATLNARTSILAAANPIGGRYDKSKPLKQNVALTPPIMSRFDLFFVVVDECDEVSDYNIARHIVALHQRTDEAVEAEYSTAQIQRYIKFARTITPEISEEAGALLTEHYRKLRQNDVVVGGDKIAYRITVRQLESMIRLSEALARLHCDPVVQPSYVEEAARLLRKSIIHVETRDIELDDIAVFGGADGDDGAAGGDGGDGGDGDDGGDGGDGGDDGGDGGDGGAAGDAAAPKRTVTITYEEYKRMAHLLVLRLRKPGVDGEKGMQQQSLVNWYLDEHAEQLTDVDALADMNRLVNQVINRLEANDGVLVVTEQNDELLVTDPETARSERWLVVHPNYSVD